MENNDCTTSTDKGMWPDAAVKYLAKKLRQTFPKEEVSLIGRIAKNSILSKDGRYYDELHDIDNPTKSVLIPIKSTDSVRPELVSGDLVQVFATIGFGNLDNDNGIKLYFNVNRIGRIQSTSEYLESLHKSILEAKEHRGRKNIKEVLEDAISDGKKPRIGIIISPISVVKKEFETALGSMANRYNIEYIFTDTSDITGVVKAITSIDQRGYTVFATMGGGGQGCAWLTNEHVEETLGKVSTPYVQAAGHEQNKNNEEDDMFVNKLADLKKSPPATFGTFLYDTALSALLKRYIYGFLAIAIIAFAIWLIFF